MRQVRTKSSDAFRTVDRLWLERVVRRQGFRGTFILNAAVHNSDLS